jgi:hypothetical protein
MSCLFNALGCNLRLLVIYPTILTSISLGVSVAPRYVPSILHTMPVTTRLQAKRLLERCGDHSITSSLGSTTSLSTSMMSMRSSSTTTSSTMDFSILTMQASDLSDQNQLPFNTSPFSIPPTNASISNFQNLEISKTVNFDPGISHNLAVSNISIMEADCKDDDGARNVSPKMEESLDLNKVLSVLTAHITASTAQMTSDFHQVISANDNFKQEVREANENFQRGIRDDILELRSLLHLQHSNVPMTSSSASTAPIQVTTFCDSTCCIIQFSSFDYFTLHR